MITVRRPEHDIPVEYLSGIRDGDYAYWKYFDFTNANIDRFVCKTWGKNTAATIEIRLDAPDGELIGSCELDEMDGEVAYGIHKTTVNLVTGKHAVVLVFKSKSSDNASQNLMNLEWFMFESK